MSRSRVIALVIFFGALALLFAVRPGLSQDQVPYEKWNLLVDVVMNVKQRYVDEVSDEELFQGAIDGMMKVLDPHSVYVSPENLKEFDIGTRGKFSGIGIEISLDDGWLTVISPIPDGPASKAGVRAGDKIIEIEGESTEDMSILDAVKQLRGQKGTKVTITVLHMDSTAPEEVTIVRDDIKVPSVAGVKHLPDGDWDFMFDKEAKIGYIRLSAFQENTIDQLDTAINKLLAQGMKGLVLDLRYNPGGLLEAAVAIADRFLDGGTIVSTRGRSSPTRVHKAHKHGTYEHFNLVVLVNEWSASASEILAGAIQDNHRGLLLGTRTFGKGSVQALINLDDGDSGALKLTVAKYYTPSGKLIHRNRSTRRLPGEKRPSKKKVDDEDEEEDDSEDEGEEDGTEEDEGEEIEVEVDEEEEGGLKPTIIIPMPREDQVRLQRSWSEANRSYEKLPTSQPADEEPTAEEEPPFVDAQLQQAITILKGYDALSQADAKKEE